MLTVSGAMIAAMNLQFSRCSARAVTVARLGSLSCKKEEKWYFWNRKIKKFVFTHDVSYYISLSRRSFSMKKYSEGKTTLSIIDLNFCERIYVFLWNSLHSIYPMLCIIQIFGVRQILSKVWSVLCKNMFQYTENEQVQGNMFSDCTVLASSSAPALHLLNELMIAKR